MNRIIGQYSSGQEGPLVWVTAGVHGNEPSGVEALENVFNSLSKQQPHIKGKLVGIKGNQKALQLNRRFIDEDLNRTWKKDKIETQQVRTHEEAEMQDIIQLLNKHWGGKEKQPAYFLDCHTTSSESAPYISVQVKNDNAEWSQRFPTKIVRGFSDMVEGSIDHYFTDLGMTGFTFEAGSHQNPESAQHHESMIWLILKEACDLSLDSLTEYPNCTASLRQFEQQSFDIIYRHELQASDKFEMKPGFHNFDHIVKNEVLATHNGREIRSQWNAHIFMPLYQGQGNDGFFVVEEIK
ncbi:M14 family metallopeptidase [Nonlabens xiamenensis]|uniref:succinylglutamate desuccinylase/aspartoacylase domain-containing protein n=1 Tax=Nonlabens xiamenensis TaxID=2341043 RepID=UPI001F0C56DB|nr:succinylglutamate desuccinylase/aspartoacylase family protein [Nonlabens xiamenensis]